MLKYRTIIIWGIHYFPVVFVFYTAAIFEKVKVLSAKLQTSGVWKEGRRIGLTIYTYSATQEQVHCSEKLASNILQLL